MVDPPDDPGTTVENLDGRVTSPPPEPDVLDGTSTEPADPGARPDTTPHEEDGGTPPRAWAGVVAWGTGLRPAWRALAAYLMYQALAFAIWVIPILPRFTRQHVGPGLQDSRYFQWALEWTPWAVSHGVNPLRANVFGHGGVDLGWSSFIPGPALVMWPVTAVFGPMTSLNLLLVAAPALAGWAAYLVCNRVTHRFWPSVVGGCLFGFSTYMASNLIGFVNLVLIFPIPLLVYVVIRYVEGSLGWVTFVVSAVALLLGLFSISTEVFGTAALFGGVAYLGALAFGSGVRPQLVRAGGLLLLAGGVTAIALIPYLRDVISNAPDAPVRGIERISVIDLWGFVVPPPQTRLGGSAFLAVSQQMSDFPVLNGLGYLGIVTVAILVSFAITERRRRATWLLLGFIGFVSLLAMGPVLRIGGEPHGWLPGDLLVKAPIIQSALPSRLVMYSSLAIGVVVAIWLSHAAGRWAWLRWAAAIVAIVMIVPRAPNHAAPQQEPAFLSSDRLPEVIRDGELVYAIPYMKGDEMVWQAMAGFRFDLAQGYIGPIPDELKDGALSRGLQAVGKRIKTSSPPPPAQFASWMQRHGVSVVVVDDRARDRYASMLDDAGFRPVFEGEGASAWRP